MNHWKLYAPDIMHEFELGVWKAILTHLLRILHLLLFLHHPYAVISHLGNHPLTHQQALQALHAHHLLLHLLHTHELLLRCLHHLHVPHLLHLRVPLPMTMQTIMLASDPILHLLGDTFLRVHRDFRAPSTMRT